MCHFKVEYLVEEASEVDLRVRVVEGAAVDEALGARQVVLSVLDGCAQFCDLTLQLGLVDERRDAQRLLVETRLVQRLRVAHLVLRVVGTLLRQLVVAVRRVGEVLRRVVAVREQRQSSPRLQNHDF